MKQGMLAIVCALGLVLGGTPGGAQAAVKKKVATAPRPARTQVRRPAAPAAPAKGAPDLTLRSASVFVQDQTNGRILIEKNARAVVPIASITKLMTAMVVLGARPDLAELLVIDKEDVDTLKGTSSRLAVGTRLTREELLRLALMSSENRAAAALSRYYPGGRDSCIVAMNRQAKRLGLTDTKFYDPTGLTAANVSNARDLARMVAAACEFPLIREFTTTAERCVTVRGRPQTFRNTNPLVRNPSWSVGLSKTGYIAEAGRCLVMQALVNRKPTVIVLLNSWGKLTRVGDANRIRRLLESGAPRGQRTAG